MADVELALLFDRFMRRIHTALQSKASTFDTEKVGPAGGMVLLTLAEMGRTEMHTLTERFQRDKSQMTRVIRVLEEKGLVARSLSERDRRVSILSLTGEGRQVVVKLEGALAETIGELLAPLHNDEKEQLKEMLKRVGL